MARVVRMTSALSWEGKYKSSAMLSLPNVVFAPPVDLRAMGNWLRVRSYDFILAAAGRRFYELLV